MQQQSVRKFEDLSKYKKRENKINQKTQLKPHKLRKGCPCLFILWIRKGTDTMLTFLGLSLQSCAGSHITVFVEGGKKQHRTLST